MIWTLWGAVGAVFAATSVAFGAFAAHALRDYYSAEKLLVFETAARYQMYHALGLLAVGAIASRIDNLALQLSGGFFVLGIFLFSGSLYALVLTDNRSLGMVTPFGGLSFMAGWCCLAFALLKP